MKRLIPLLVTTFLLATVASGGIWLGFSESGLGALARLAVSAGGGRLGLEQPTGRLVGPLAIGRVTWNEPGTSIVIEGLQLDWSRHNAFEFTRVSLWGHDFGAGQQG